MFDCQQMLVMECKPIRRNKKKSNVYMLQPIGPKAKRRFYRRRGGGGWKDTFRNIARYHPAVAATEKITGMEPMPYLDLF